MDLNIDRAMLYLDFVAERHRIWEQRQAGAPGPWTDDPVLRARKFTNVFRVLDPGSQFILTDLLADEPAPRDALTRVFLYRFTNLVDFWPVLRAELGRYPDTLDLAGGEDGRLAKLFSRLAAEGHKIFSGAYVTQPAANGRSGYDKGRVVAGLAWRVLHPASEDNIWAACKRAGSLEELVQVLASPNRMGTFLAQQMVTDLGYAGYHRFSEDDYVVTGPGSRLGAAYLTGTDRGDKRPTLGGPAAVQARTLAAIGWAQYVLEAEGPALVLPDGRLRSPSLMDVQNTFCEFGKYMRHLDNPRPVYRPAHPGPQPAPILPEHW